MKQEKDIGHLRKSYEKGSLDDDKKSVNPLSLFEDWFSAADENPAIEEANAMSVATLGVDGFPKSRIVLLKQFSPEGFVFHTNYNSQKGRAIAAYDKVGLTFFWPSMERQILIKGIAKKVSQEASDKYFYSRPKGSQIGAIVSPQSQPIENRDFLENRLNEVENQYKENSPKRPDHWGGFIVQPTTIEFWQGRPNRLHDRMEFSLNEDNSWSVSRLAP
jgi:pyridoxamine 5'-phosphate oxidase